MKKIIFLFSFSLNLFSASLVDVYPAVDQVLNGYVWHSYGWSNHGTSIGRCGRQTEMGSINGYVYHDFGPANNGDPTQCYSAFAEFYKTSTPAPTTCSWATTPPWYSTTRDESHCNNYEKGNVSFDLEDPMYYFNFTWCSANSTCYARIYYCPAGQNMNHNTHLCEPVKKPAPDPKYCPAGYYPGPIKHIADTSGTDKCGQDWFCKNDPKIIINREFSCGAGPVDESFPDTNPTAPDADVTPSANPYKDGVSACSAKRGLAQLLCQPPKIFTFECDPTTGTPIKSSCVDPTVSPDKPLDSGDDTKGATTADIKTLGNDLPKAIKDSLKDYFTDGSTPYLDSIKGSLEAVVMLSADTNDKLDSISSSTDAGLQLQSETNGKLDQIKTAIDNVNPSSNSNETGTGITDFINDSDLIPDGSIKESVEGLSSDIGSIGTQFSDLKSLVSGNFTPPPFNDGSMPSFSANFHGTSITVDTNKLTDLLAPYSPLIAILTYISLMFLTFRSVFKFFSRGVQ